MSLLKHLLRNAYYQYYSSDSYRSPGFSGIHRIFQKNKVLIVILLAAAGLFLLLCLAAFIIAFPLLLAVLKWIYQNGFSGILELLLTFFEKFWKGAGGALLL